MAYKYYGSAQFSQLMEQRDHNDKFFSEIVRMGSVVDKDIGEFIVEDILRGNTHTLSKHYKKGTKNTPYKPFLIDGVTLGEHGAEIENTLYPMVPIKDDYSASILGNTSSTYADLPKDDERRISVNKTLSSLNMDWEEIAKKIVAPEDIPPIYDEQGNISADFKTYYDAWKDSPSLQEKYPTIEAYHTQLVQDLADQRKSIQYLSDIFIGLCVTGEYFSEENTAAIYHTFTTEIFPFLTEHSRVQDGYEGFPPLTWSFEYGSGEFGSIHTFTTVNGFSGWSHVIRSGVISNEFDMDDTGNMGPKWYKGKTNWKIYRPSVMDDMDDTSEEDEPMDDMDNNNIVHEKTPPLTDGDPIIEVIADHIPTDLDPDEPMDEEADGENPFEDPVTGEDMFDRLKPVKGSAIVIQVQLTADTYGEIRLYDYGTAHALTGNDGTVSIVVGTINGDEEAEHEEVNQSTDFGLPLVWLPISYKSTKKIPLFKRERLIRESLVLSIYSQQKIKVKWYQSGWFKVVLFVISIIVAAVIGPGGFAALLSWQTIVVTALEMAFSMILIQVVMNMIDNPMLVFILAILLSYFSLGSGFNFSMSATFDAMISLVTNIMNAAGTAISKYYQQKMEELREELEAFKKQAKAAENELERLQEEAGGIIRSDMQDMTTYLASLPPVEGVENFFERTLDSGFAIIDAVDDQVDIMNLFPDMLRT